MVADTKERLLDAAETVFGERGYAGTSLRMITVEADTNIAAVNYHFGSKRELMLSAMTRYAEPVNSERLRMLDVAAATADGSPLLEEVLRSFLLPPLLFLARSGKRAPVRARFFGRAYAEPVMEIRADIRALFSRVMARYIDVLQRALPDVPDDELVWRALCVVDVLTATFVDDERIAVVTDVESAERLMGRMVRFLAPGLRA